MTLMAFAVSDGFFTVIQHAKWLHGKPDRFGPTGVSLNVTLPIERAGSVIISQAEHDNAEWIHASLALAGSMPTYDDLVTLHRAVFGRRRFAYQVFAPESRHVNIHEHALHLWGRADGTNMLPDFGAQGTI